MRIRVVPEFRDARMPIERRLDDPALHPSTAAVHQSYFAEAGAGGGFDIFIDDRRNVARRKRVQIELVFDGDADRLVSH